ncbi:MAG: cache domain-containing protein [Clostridia bacterium]|nr:cache domain-containing protein [Clostridia bacterium]
MRSADKKSSIHEKLIEVNLYKTAIPMIILVAILMCIVSVFLVTEMYKRSNDIMYSIKASLDQNLDQYEKKLDEIYDVVISNGQEDSMNIMLDAYVRNNAEIMSLVILDDHGLAIGGAPESIVNIGHDHSGHDYYKLLESEGSIFWSDVFMVHGANIPMVSISKKYHNVIVVLQINLEELTTFLNIFDISTNSYIAITDKTGTYLAHSDYGFVVTRTYDRERKNLIEKAPRNVNYNGHRMLAFHEQMSQNEWSIIYYQSLWDMMMPLLSIIGLGALIIVIISIHVLRMVFKLDNKLSGEVGELVYWSNKVSRGQYDIDFTESSIFEINNLYDAFNIMTQSVLTREGLLEEQRKEIIEINKGLEIEVKNRTIDLEKSLEDLRKTQMQLI